MRLIDANKIPHEIASNSDFVDDISDAVFMVIRKAIDKIPTINAVSVKYAAWVGSDDGEEHMGRYETYECSNCGYQISWRDYDRIMNQEKDGAVPENSFKEYYCPHCGARMVL